MGLCRQPIFIELALKCNRRKISQTCLFAQPPVKYFDVFGDGLNGLGAGLEAPVMHQFIFKQSLAFHGGVVVAVPSARHRWHHAELIEQFSVLMGAILATPIRVVYQSARWAFCHHTPKQRLANQVSGYARSWRSPPGGH